MDRLLEMYVGWLGDIVRGFISWLLEDMRLDKETLTMDSSSSFLSLYFT